jgi:hypothetical protein
MTYTFVEAGVEYFLPTESPKGVPGGFSAVELPVDKALLQDDRSVALDEAAEEWCNEHGFVFSQVIESGEW